MTTISSTYCSTGSNASALAVITSADITRQIAPGRCRKVERSTSGKTLDGGGEHTAVELTKEVGLKRLSIKHRSQYQLINNHVFIRNVR